ncbi:hypothetical protein [Ferruginivarius sediminum]|uniref:HprK-related kinase A n=1 Tax=Ferruginivarius sediminum TaxID=2661937 RepID=A0A369T4X1_9PROT|nr:hypothetical protein [Ferruginivarius sediminum]RDD60380.1 hypothetical protein DRB17_18260 [Ferruginivarius sediminum]
MTTQDDLLFAIPGGSLRVAGAGALAGYVRLLLPRWPVDIVPRRKGADIAVERRGTAFCLGADREMLESAQDAAFSLVNRVITAALAKSTARLTVHAAGVLVPGASPDSAILLVGPTHAGKSTLSLLLASGEACMLGDDVILVEDGDGDGDGDRPTAASLGLAPKVRLPLPPRIAEAAAGYIEDVEAARIADVAYLHPRDGELAPFGRHFPVTSLVLLERLPAEDTSASDAPASLAPLSRSIAVRRLLANCYAPHLASDQKLRSVVALAQHADCHALRFHDSVAAADLIRETFG